MTVTDYKPYIYCLHLYKDIHNTCLLELLPFGHEERSLECCCHGNGIVCQIKSTKHPFVLFPCFPLCSQAEQTGKKNLNMWLQCDSEQDCSAHRPIFFLTSKQNLCSRSFRVNVWMGLNACTVSVFVLSALSPVSIFGAHWLWSEVRPDRSVAQLAFFFFSFHSFWNDSFLFALLSFSFAHIAFSCVTSLRSITSLN